MSATRLQELQICFGFGKQTDIATANLVAAMWRLKKLNAQLANPKLNTENDAEEYGKGASANLGPTGCAITPELEGGPTDRLWQKSS
jgi:hypothetical protein